MKPLNMLFILSVAYVSAVFAQETGTISGRVLDKRTQKPLIGTNVIIVGSNRGTATGVDGRFTIPNIPVGTYSLRFNYIGYVDIFKTDIVVTTAKPVFLTVEMVQQAVQSEKVTVTAGYFNQELKVEPSTISLSQEEIRRFPGGFEDVVRTVSTLPGVAINMTGGRNDLLVRGGGPSENLYVINNIEVPNINHFGTQGSTGGSLSFVNLDFVEKVDFATGGFGVEYGDKMSSVLTLNMINERPEKIEGKATISATQFGFDFQTPLTKKGNMIVSARKSYLDLIFKAAGLPFVPVYTDYNVLINMDLSPRDRLFFLGLSAVNNVDRDQSSEENRVTNAELLDNTQYRGISGLNYRRILDTGFLDFTFNVNLSRYDFSQINEEEIEYFSSEADELETGLKMEYSWTPGKRFLVKSGIAQKWISNTATTLFADTIYDRSGNRIPLSMLGLAPENRIDDNFQKQAFFTQLNWQVLSFLDIRAGLRLDRYPYLDDPTCLSPRVSLKIKPHSSHSFRLSGGLYYQSPAYVWLANPVNSRLKPLRNSMLIAGWDWLIRTDLRVTVEGFHKAYSNLPTGTVPGVNDYIVMTNTGSGYGGREDDFQSFGFIDLTSQGTGIAYGGELLLQKKFSTTPLYGQMSLSWSRSELTAANGRTYPGQYDQRVIFNLSGGYKFNSRWEMSAKFRYFTGIPYTPVYRPSDNPGTPGSIQNLPDEYLSARLDPGHHLDVRVERIFNFPAWTLITYIDIQNIYNFKIPMRPTYDFWADEINNTASIGILPSVGISVQL
ncbi:TonB-dependent receptor [bacterium]|nr:TonB-dependent receptor [bacterium]